ncbi:MAG: HEAT repeat domain-containing protein, partial [Methylococcales bacterium]|nr:HEAT repeat domain-containing protein [Methylococcales bacterium]
MKYIGYINLLALSLCLVSCKDDRPDAEVVEGLRGMYPGGGEFGRYKERVVSRGIAIVPELIVASKDPDSQMRESAYRCLGHIGSAEAVERLIVMADDDDIEDTIWIALSYAGSPKAIPKLEEELT